MQPRSPILNSMQLKSLTMNQTQRMWHLLEQIPHKHQLLSDQALHGNYHQHHRLRRR